VSLLQTYVEASAKIDARREGERYNRPTDPAHNLTDAEAAICLLVLRVQNGTLSPDSLTDDQRACVVYALQTEKEDND
jgi:hypothetical protein